MDGWYDLLLSPYLPVFYAYQDDGRRDENWVKLQWNPLTAGKISASDASDASRTHDR